MRHFLKFMIFGLLLMGAGYVQAQSQMLPAKVSLIVARGSFHNQFDTALRNYSSTRFPMYTTADTNTEVTTDTFWFETNTMVHSLAFGFHVDRLAGRSDSVSITVFESIGAPPGKTPKLTQLATTTFADAESNYYEYVVNTTNGFPYKRIYFVLKVANTIPTASIRWQGSLWPQ